MKYRRAICVCVMLAAGPRAMAQTSAPYTYPQATQ